VGIATVERVRKRFIEESLEAALNERPGPGGQRKLDGKQEAFLSARPVVPYRRRERLGRCNYSRISSSKLRVIDAISD
jgi:hypothetical protein